MRDNDPDNLTTFGECEKKEFPLNAICEISCAKGYKLQPGTNGNLTCGENGQFTFVLPICILTKYISTEEKPCLVEAGQSCTADSDCISDKCKELVEGEGKICVVECMLASFSKCGECDYDWCQLSANNPTDDCQLDGKVCVEKVKDLLEDCNTHLDMCDQESFQKKYCRKSCAEESDQDGAILA
jgi:hypothetical protein